MSKSYGGKSGTRRRAARGIVIVLFSVWIASGCAAPRTPTSPGEAIIGRQRVTMTLLVVGIDEAKVAGDLDYRRLREFAGMDVPMEGRRRAESWADVHRLIDRLRAMGAATFVVQPEATAREGAEVALRMRGIDRTVLSLTLRAQMRRTGTFAVDVGVRFDGDERGDNRWETMEYRGSSLRFADERLLVDDGDIEGVEMQPALGRITEPSDMRLLAFVRVQRVAEGS